MSLWIIMFFYIIVLKLIIEYLKVLCDNLTENIRVFIKTYFYVHTHKITCNIYHFNRFGRYAMATSSGLRDPRDGRRRVGVTAVYWGDRGWRHASRATVPRDGVCDRGFLEISGHPWFFSGIVRNTQLVYICNCNYLLILHDIRPKYIKRVLSRQWQGPYR